MFAPNAEPDCVAPPVAGPLPTRGLIAIGWILLAYFAVRTAMLGRIGADVRTFQVAYLIGFTGYSALLLAVRRSTGGSVIGSWRRWIVGCVLLRVVMLGVEPSDDTYRYVWEGRVQLAGYNPFSHAPTDDALAHLRNPDWAKINHPDYPAIYPPLAQMEFLAVAAASTSVYAVKVVHVIWDVGALLLIGACLARVGRAQHWAIVYGLCPLVLTAFGVEGHVDSLMLLGVMACVWAVLSGRVPLAGLFLGLAISAKLVPIVLLPWLILRCRRAAVLAGAIVLLTYLPYVGAGTGLGASLVRWGRSEQFFGLLGTFHVTGHETAVGRALVTAALAAVLVTLAWRIRTFPRYAIAATGALLLLSPIVHYWYLAWVVVLLPLDFRWPWLAAALGMAGYFEAAWYHETTGEWFMPTWPNFAVWVPFVLVCGIDAAVSWRARRHARTRVPPSEDAALPAKAGTDYNSEPKGGAGSSGG